MPRAVSPATLEAISEAMPVREFAVTRVISRGSSLGVTEARVTAYAFCSTSTPNAAGRSSTTSLCSTAATIPQHSRPRAISVPASRYRRPCFARSSIGPITGARMANGAMVMIRVSAIRPRAWSSEVLKNSVPARAMVTKASPAAPAADSSMRLDRPVRLAPEAPVIRCTTRLVRRAAPALARPLERAAEETDRPACLAAVQASPNPIVPVFCVGPVAGNAGPGRRPPKWPHHRASMHPDGEQLLTVSPIRARKPEPDEICVQAVDLARAAAVDMAGPGHVGEHIGADAEA